MDLGVEQTAAEANVFGQWSTCTVSVEANSPMCEKPQVFLGACYWRFGDKGVEANKEGNIESMLDLMGMRGAVRRLRPERGKRPRPKQARSCASHRPSTGTTERHAANFN